MVQMERVQALLRDVIVQTDHVSQLLQMQIRLSEDVVASRCRLRKLENPNEILEAPALE
jgi:hypothetical protein